jgi:hypothetical protein
VVFLFINSPDWIKLVKRLTQNIILKKIFLILNFYNSIEIIYDALSPPCSYQVFFASLNEVIFMIRFSQYSQRSYEMKFIVIVMLLSAFSAFAQKDGKQEIIKCATKCGASENSTKPVPAGTCMKVKLSKGCFCAPASQIDDHIKSCK